MIPAKTERVYVKVNSDIDATGYMRPRTITWSDGRTFQIDSIQDFCPASRFASGRSGDCYTILIQGQEKHLFFERSDPLFPSRIGRWFVERSIAPQR